MHKKSSIKPNNKSNIRSDPKSNKNATKSDVYLNFNDLDWSEVKVPDSVFMGDKDELAGFLCLEEIDNIDIEREETSTKGNTIRFKVRLIFFSANTII